MAESIKKPGTLGRKHSFPILAGSDSTQPTAFVRQKPMSESLSDLIRLARRQCAAAALASAAKTSKSRSRSDNESFVVHSSAAPASSQHGLVPTRQFASLNSLRALSRPILSRSGSLIGQASNQRAA